MNGSWRDRMSDLMTREQIIQLEQAGLLKNRYYIVLEPLDNDDDEESDGFAVRAYATKDYRTALESENFVDPTYVVLQGLLGMLNEWFEDVYDIGLERVAFEAIGEAVSEENLKPEHVEKVRSVKDNVITVNFGDTH